MFHEVEIPDEAGKQRAEAKKDADAIGAECVAVRHGMGRKWRPSTHQDTGDDASDESFARGSLIAAELAVRFAVQHHRQDAAEQTGGNHFYVALGLEDVAQNRSRYQSDADRHRESGGEAHHVNAGDEEKICEVENYAGEEYGVNIRGVRRMNIVQEAVRVVAEATYGQCIDQRREKNSDRVVPIEKLKTV